MGSRAVIVLCENEGAARRRFGMQGAGRGVVYTRTGRRFFADPAVETAVLDRVARAMEASGLWNELATDWVCLDCELMPWSAKAMDLIRNQYAPVGAAGQAMLARLAVLLAGTPSQAPVEALKAEAADRLEAVVKYRAAYAPYCWDVTTIADIRIAPFHVLASEGSVHMGRDHLWHLGLADRIAEHADGLVMSTGRRVVDLASEESRAQAIDWWEVLTGKGGEGMVVKPFDFVARGEKGLIQPAVKCRGPEYLRIIYGPEYTRPSNLERLRSRGLGGKRRLALREFGLGIEALQRFVDRQPLRAVHECVFGVLALESDPVDPRL